MTQRRLRWLAVLMMALLALRLTALLSPITSPEFASAAPSKPRPPRATEHAANAAEPASDASEPALDAFAVRRVAPPPPIHAVSRVPTLSPHPPIQLAATLPAAAPPLQVIGTWKDGDGPGVFVTGSAGTRLVRPDGVLFAQYRVVSISPTTLALKELSSNREIRMPIPAAATLATQWVKP